ncbi:phosphopantetheine-binding protein [Nonomuraea sp. MG754425]|uniref:phosphopantetheine-binding protein n=1 Tax=Nonomuraea sp. MG754425 TaxID=2570319 RepID=UPI001F3BA3C1|nr:phosphopantetheine-binding protein [Nonomuraea sp. MG754425]
MTGPDTIRTRLSAVLAAVLPVSGAEPDPGTPFTEAGLDSARAVRLVLGVEREFGVEFPDDLLDHHTFRDLGTLTRAVASLLGHSSLRLATLEAAADAVLRLGARLPARALVRTWPLPLDCGADTIEAGVRAHAERIAAATEPLGGARLLAHPSPGDELLAPHLSFAGVFRSHVPGRDAPRSGQAARGVARVLAGRRGAVADYYHRRHRLDTDRPVDVLFTALVPDVAMHGTGYAWGDHALVTCYDSPLAIRANDPLRFAAGRRPDRAGFPELIRRCLFGVCDALERPVDVEFVLTRDETLYVTQIRRMSEAHAKNWAQVPASAWEQARRHAPASNTVGGTGVRAGWAVDLRARRPGDDDAGDAARVWIVNHRDGGPGTSAIEFLRHADAAGWSDLTLVVDHGPSRIDDHRQYLTAEDPAVSFLAHAVDVPGGLDRAQVKITGDGLSAAVEPVRAGHRPARRA